MNTKRLQERFWYGLIVTVCSYVTGSAGHRYWIIYLLILDACRCVWMRTLLQITRAEREIFLKNDYCARLKNKVRFCALRRIICNTPTAGVPTRDPIAIHFKNSVYRSRWSTKLIEQTRSELRVRVLSEKKNAVFFSRVCLARKENVLTKRSKTLI